MLLQQPRITQEATSSSVERKANYKVCVQEPGALYVHTAGTRWCTVPPAIFMSTYSVSVTYTHSSTASQQPLKWGCDSHFTDEETEAQRREMLSSLKLTHTDL